MRSRPTRRPTGQASFGTCRLEQSPGAHPWSLLSSKTAKAMNTLAAGGKQRPPYHSAQPVLPALGAAICIVTQMGDGQIRDRLTFSWKGGCLRQARNKRESSSQQCASSDRTPSRLTLRLTVRRRALRISALAAESRSPANQDFPST